VSSDLSKRGAAHFCRLHAATPLSSPVAIEGEQMVMVTWLRAAMVVVKRASSIDTIHDGAETTTAALVRLLQENCLSQPGLF